MDHQIVDNKFLRKINLEEYVVVERELDDLTLAVEGKVLY